MIRDYLYLAAIAVLGAALWWFGFHERQIGERVVEKHDTQAVQVQEKHDATSDADEVEALRRAIKSQSDWIAQHPVKPLIVRRGPSCSTQGSTVAAGSQPTDVPAGIGAGMQQSDSIDIGPRVRLLATVAERAAAYDSACEATVAGRAR